MWELVFDDSCKVIFIFEYIPILKNYLISAHVAFFKHIEFILMSIFNVFTVLSQKTRFFDKVKFKQNRK